MNNIKLIISGDRAFAVIRLPGGAVHISIENGVLYYNMFVKNNIDQIQLPKFIIDHNYIQIGSQDNFDLNIKKYIIDEICDCVFEPIKYKNYITNKFEPISIERSFESLISKNHLWNINNYYWIEIKSK